MRPVQQWVPSVRKKNRSAYRETAWPRIDGPEQWANQTAELISAVVILCANWVGLE